MKLTAPTQVFEPHPEGIWPAVCVDVLDLGIVAGEWMGKKRATHKVRVVLETENPGLTKFLARTFTASLHPQSKLCEFLGKWRGKAIGPGDTIDLDNLIGVSATLVVGHRQKRDGTGLFASIDAISRPTKKVQPSGTYDPKAARERLAKGEDGTGAPAEAAAAEADADPVDVGF